MLSLDAKADTLARMLAAYDDKTWARLRPDRKRTYVRAAQTLLFNFDNFKTQFEDWKNADRTS